MRCGGCVFYDAPRDRRPYLAPCASEDWDKVKTPDDQACEFYKPKLIIEGKGYRFIASASDGFTAHRSGFFVKYGDSYAVSELTLLYGKVQTRDEKGRLREFETAQPVLLVEVDGERKAMLLTKDFKLQLGDRVVRLEGKTTANESLKTLMTLETCQKLLAGAYVHIKGIYPRVVEQVKRFVCLDWDPRLYHLAACYIISTYFFDIFTAFPIVFIYGPPETGKGRLLKTMVFMSRKGLTYVGAREASIFRVIDAFRPTLGIDEFTRLYEELAQILRASYKRGEKVPRVEQPKGKRWVLRLFETYTPIVLASTASLEPMLLSRSIIINMRRGPDPSKRDPEPEDFEELRNDLYLARFTCALEVYETVKQLDKMDLGLCGREWEIWRPILTIAKLVDEDVFQRLLSLARELFQEKNKDLYVEERNILQAVESLAQDSGWPVEFTPKQLHDRLWILLQEELDEKSFEKTYSTRRLGWILKRMGVRRRRKGKKGARTYEVDESTWADLVSRYSYNSFYSLKNVSNVRNVSQAETKPLSQKEAQTEPILEGEKKPDLSPVSEKKPARRFADVADVSDVFVGRSKGVKKVSELSEVSGLIPLARRVLIRISIDGLADKQHMVNVLRSEGVEEPERLVEWLKQHGYLYEPKPGWLRWLK